MIWDSTISRVDGFITPSFEFIGLNNSSLTLSSINITSLNHGRVIWDSGVSRVNSLIAPSFKLVSLNNSGLTLSSINIAQLNKSLGCEFLLKSMVFLALSLRFSFKRFVFLLKMLIVKLELVNFILDTVVARAMVTMTKGRLRNAEEKGQYG